MCLCAGARRQLSLGKFGRRNRPARTRRESECDDDLIIIEDDNLEALSRGTDLSPDEAWADAVAAMGADRARMFSSDADVEPVPGLGFGLGID